jgi:hypothetical protein
MSANHFWHVSMIPHYLRAPAICRPAENMLYLHPKADSVNMAGISDLISSCNSQGSCPGEECRVRHIPPGGILDVSEIHYGSENLFLHAFHPRIHFSIFVRNLLLFFLTQIKRVPGPCQNLSIPQRANTSTQ